MTRGIFESDRDARTPEPTGPLERERVLYVGRDRPIRICAGHRILHHDGKCARPHGHNYEISVAITGRLTEEGWVVDKGVVTDVIDEWDHMFIVQAGDPLVEAFEATGDDDALVVLEHPPTAEVMSAVLEERLEAALPDTVSTVAVQVRETGELCTGSPF
ncbi:6-pyruvoyl trahydropterin synthase family protein [Natronobiforma cellulositropha]|uniref:6-pyruvoyl trahydropterin synthase family protein n=1 Tax=Natronobiforma cellulositropha TaxID=1679076 RepID=UPI0021D60B56|nr:6-pyruvoyl tetrahydropterin synthase family protein [Natronobiforma cellulositropha]